mgnify:CR=1 FL=1
MVCSGVNMSNVGHKHKVWVNLQQLGSVPDSFNPATWSTVHQVPVSIQPMRGGEVIAGQKVQEHITHVIHTRYMPNITGEWRVQSIDASRTWNIDAAINVQEQNKYLELHCVEAR